jgi:hypothetical protein
MVVKVRWQCLARVSACPHTATGPKCAMQRRWATNGRKTRFCRGFRLGNGGVAHFGDVDKTRTRSYISAAFSAAWRDTRNSKPERLSHRVDAAERANCAAAPPHPDES